MDIEALRPIDHDDPMARQPAAAMIGIVIGGLAVIIVGCGGVPVAGLAMAGGAVGVAVAVRRWWRGTCARLPRALALTRREPATSIAVLVDAIVSAALDSDADKIRFCAYRGDVGVFFDRARAAAAGDDRHAAGARSRGTSCAMVVPVQLARLLVDDLVARAGMRGAAGDRGELTTTIGSRPVQLRIVLGATNALTEIELVRRWS